jgi:hypothetical protein
MDAQKMMGFEVPGDKKVPVTVRDWSAMKLALWRSRGLAEIAVREATEIVNHCKHLGGCLGASDETEPCFSPTFHMNDAGATEVQSPGCPDREVRMSALVILNAARQLAPADARKPSTEPYFAPSREYFSEVIAALSAAQMEAELLREVLREAGIPVPNPDSGNSNAGGDPPEPAQLAPSEETS